MRRVILSLIGLIAVVGAGMVGVPILAAHSYGPPAAGLSLPEVVQYSARLLWDDGLLSKPLNAGAPEQTFTVEQGESVASIADRLQGEGLISNGSMFRDYLVYTGLDTTIQAGNYKLSAGMSVVDIAHKMQDATPADVTFVVLPGWRMEEIAASIPTSGLGITPEQFMAAASTPNRSLDFLEGATSNEGFLYPDSYILPRAISADQVIDTLLRDFALHLTADLREGFAQQGLNVYQAVTLASIVEREAVQEEEAPIIASVYLNRLKMGMRLDADPTVQYAVGYNKDQQTWWTNPLSAEDLQFPSAFNTYLIDGLPPTPIDNPGPDSLQAVAAPAKTPYFYFSARCDGSGYHVFAQTFEEHLQNLCP